MDYVVLLQLLHLLAILVRLLNIRAVFCGKFIESSLTFCCLVVTCDKPSCQKDGTPIFVSRLRALNSFTTI